MFSRTVAPSTSSASNAHTYAAWKVITVPAGTRCLRSRRHPPVSPAYAISHHSHLSEALGEMSPAHMLEQVQNQSSASISNQTASGKATGAHYIYRQAPEQHGSSTSVHGVHLDGRTDAAEVLARLRDTMLGRGSAIVAVSEGGAALQDAVSVLVLLEEDIRSEDPLSTILFQPVLDSRFRRSTHQGHALPSHVDDPFHTAGPSTSSPGALALLITRAKVPQLLFSKPASELPCEVSGATDPGLLANWISAYVRQFTSTRIRCGHSEASLRTAFHALAHARMLVRSLGSHDILIAPRVELEYDEEEDGDDTPELCEMCNLDHDPALATTDLASSASSVSSGAGSGHLVDLEEGHSNPWESEAFVQQQWEQYVRQQQEQQRQQLNSHMRQRAVLYFHVWCKKLAHGTVHAHGHSAEGHSNGHSTIHNHGAHHHT